MDRAEAASLPAVLAAFEHLPAISWILQGPEHRIIAANRLARAAVGDRPDLLGRPVREALPEVTERDIAEVLDAVRDTGAPVVGVERRFELDRDGYGVPEEGFYNFDVLPLPAPDGDPLLLVHAIDVTAVVRQRQHAEAEADDARELLAAERRVVLELQRTLLPSGLPVLPDLALGAAYVPAARWLAAGGDWYDAVVMPDERLGLVVGDVVGHGAIASAVMGQLRAVAAERLTRGCSIGEVFGALDRMAGLTVDGRGSTVCLAVLDRTTGTFHYATRGHPLPVLLGADGSTRAVTGSIGPPLGLPDTEPVVSRERLRPGETLLLFSDGAVERPGRGIAEGVEELCVLVSEAVRAPNGEVAPRARAELVCAAVARSAGDPGTDDLSVLAATRLATPTASLVLPLPGVPDALGMLHRELGRWLTGLALSGDDQISLEIAVVEAVTNSIEHGYRDKPGEVRVELMLDASGAVLVTVGDRGGWREPEGEDPFRGRGLMMMRECCDRLDLDATPDGTTVHMRRMVRAQAIASAAAPPRAPAPRAEFSVAGSHDGEAAQLALAGVLDTSNADQLRTAIRGATRPGIVRCTLDLAGVILLASAALRVLFEQESRIRAAGGELVLVAAVGSPAWSALAVSGLDRMITIRPGLSE
jgi:anti-anti-sigma factor